MRATRGFFQTTGGRYSRATLLVLGLLVVAFFSAAIAVDASPQVGADGYPYSPYDPAPEPEPEPEPDFTVPGTVSPASGCRGAQIVVSGTGAEPGGPVRVFLGYPNSIGGTSAEIGTTAAGPGGEWSVAGTVPRESYTCNTHDKLAAREWPVSMSGAPTAYFDHFDRGERSIGTFQVLDCDVQGVNRLPSTGHDYPKQLFSVVLASGGLVALICYRRQLRSEGGPS